MNKELILYTHSGGTDIALLEDKKLTELHQERGNNPFNVGDIFLARIRKTMPGLNAAFVDAGGEKEGFMHYTDLSPQLRSLLKYSQGLINRQYEPKDLLNHFELEPEIEKGGNIRSVLEPKKVLLVQVTKEPISTKGPRLSGEISLAGRFLVLTPFDNTVGVSKKIESAEERKRLKVLVESLKPKNFGVIVRTVAEGKGASELHQDILDLQKRWEEMARQAVGAQAPKKVLQEVNKASGIIRDLLNADFQRIVTNHAGMAREIEELLLRIAPDKKGIVSHYTGKIPVFDQYGITRQIKASFGKTLNMASGSYLILEKTEALHVIDVNSGHRAISSSQSQENNALKINTEAAQEIARLLRLRDMGGIIVIDFIDMKDPEKKKQLFNSMRDFMEGDRATHTILPLSKFNIMQITRERVRPEVVIATAEKCPTCGGSGEINASILLIDQLYNDVKHVISNHRRMSIYVHPIIGAYLLRGWPSLRMKWMWEFKKWIRIYFNEDLGLTDYQFFDEQDEQIVVNN